MTGDPLDPELPPMTNAGLAFANYLLLQRLEATQQEILQHLQRHDDWIAAQELRDLRTDNEGFAVHEIASARLTALELGRKKEGKGAFALISICLFDILAWIGQHLSASSIVK